MKFRFLVTTVATLGLATSVFAAANDQATDTSTQGAAPTTMTAPEAKPAHHARQAVQAMREKVNINTATADDLIKALVAAKIKQKKAEALATAIVNYRDKNGNFNSVSDLAKVKGISKRFIKKNANRFTATAS